MSIKKQGKLFFLFAALLVFLDSSADGNQSLLTRTWKLEDLRYSTPIAKQFRPDVDKAVNDMRKDFTLTYRSDGTYTAMMSGKALNGKWKYYADSAKLSVVTDQGVQEDYKVVQLSDDTFAFKKREAKQEIEFVMVPASRSGAMWIGFGAIAVLVLGASAFFAYRGREKNINKK